MIFDDYDEFCSEEEIEAYMDSEVLAMAEQADLEDRQNMIINPPEIKKLMAAYYILKKIIKDMDAKISYSLYEPYTSMGSVTIICKKFVLSDSKWFVKASKLASNINIYPKTDGTVQIDFTFHGITKPLE